MTAPHRIEMGLLFALLTSFAAVPAPAWAAAPPAAAPDVRRDATVEAVQKVMPSVVNIATEEVVPIRDPLENLFRDFFDPYYRQRRPDTQYSLGSGVILDEEGYIVTNFHVVGRARRVWVRLHDGRELEAEKVAVLPSSDLALIRLKAKPGETFAAVPLAADDDLLLGETVLALGNPFGLGGSVSRGILSSKTRRPPSESEPMDVADWLQTDAAINPGNSGGPLVNLKGELIGINVAVLNQAQGIGFAIPVRRVADKLAEIFSPEAMDGIWFGARVRPGRAPLVITAVEPESPADQAGLKPGDRVHAVNGKALRSFIDFTGALRAARDKQPLELSLRRGNDRRTITVRQVPEDKFFNAELVRKKIGATVQPLGAAQAQSLGFFRAEGLYIAGVERLGPAAVAELGRGMVIRSLDGEPVSSVTAAARKLHAKARGDKVRLQLLVPVQRGAFLRLSEATVELTVR